MVTEKLRQLVLDTKRAHPSPTRLSNEERRQLIVEAETHLRFAKNVAESIHISFDLNSQAHYIHFRKGEKPGDILQYRQEITQLIIFVDRALGQYQRLNDQTMIGNCRKVIERLVKVFINAIPVEYILLTHYGEYKNPKPPTDNLGSYLLF